MQKLLTLLLVLLSSQVCFAESTPYPIFYDNNDSYLDEEENEPEAKPKEDSPYSRQFQVGNVEVEVEVDNPDFASQCKAEWKKNDPNAKEDHEPTGSVSIKWSSEH